MNVEIIVACERCGKKFVLIKPPDFYFSSLYNCDHTGLKFDAKKGPLIRRRYIDAFSRSEYYVDFAKTDPITLCQACDEAYWENFDHAVEVLADFWADPVKDEDDEQ